MSVRLAREIRNLKERLGVGLDELTAEELEKLVLACRRCDNPFSSVNRELCEEPIRVCRGVYMFPVTAGAQVWLEEYAGSWWEQGSAMYRWAQAYALCHAREPEAFAGLTTKWKARAAILKTVLRFACHQRELQEAMDRAYRPTEDLEPARRNETDKRAAEDFASLVARLEVHSGIPARTWLWGKSFLETARAYAELHKFAQAFSGGEHKHMRDELDAAINDLARVKSAIARRIASTKEKMA